MIQIHTVYALLDQNFIPHYVGRTGDATICFRMRAHRSPSQIVSARLCDWLADNRVTFIAQALELCLPQDAPHREYEWIRKFRAMGYEMANILPRDAMDRIEQARAA